MRRSKPLRSSGARVRADEQAYRAAKDTLRGTHPECQLGDLIATVDGRHRCRGVYQGPHHLRKTGQGGSMVLLDNMLSSCHPCNEWVENNPAAALELGLVVVEGDPRWEQLGRRAERLA